MGQNEIGADAGTVMAPYYRLSPYVHGFFSAIRIDFITLFAS